MSDQKSESKFLSLSPIHGFGFIIDSETKIERIAWYSCMAVSLVFLTVDTYGLYNQYKNYVGTSYTKLTMNSSGTPVQVPIDLCFKLNLIDLRNMLTTNFSAEQFYYEQWNEYMNETMRNRTAMLVEHGTSDNGVQQVGELDLYLYIIFTYFQRMFNWENNAGIPHKYFDVDGVDKEWPRFLVNNSLHHDMVHIDSILEYWNVTSHLFRDFYTRMFHLLGKDVYDDSLINPHPGVTILSTIYGYDFRFCYRLLLPRLKEETNPSNDDDDTDNSGWIPWSSIDIQFEHIKSMAHMFTIKLLDADKGYGILDVRAGERKTIVIDLNSVSVSLRNKNKCSDDGLLLHECRLKCQINAIENVCKCTPFLDQLLSNNFDKRFCKYGDYRICLRTVQRKTSNTSYTKIPLVKFPKGDQDYLIIEHILNYTTLLYKYNNRNLDVLKCQRKCLPSCTKRIWTMIEQTITPTKISNRAIADLQFRSSTYPVFEEVPYPMEFQNFISSVGGNMGIWFGASFLSIIHIAIFAVRYVVVKCKKNSVSSSINLADDRQIPNLYADSIVDTEWKK